jgi:hypothetical protein
MSEGVNLDIEQLEKIADKLSDLNERRDDLALEIKALKDAGKGLGFNMSAVDAIVKLRANKDRYEKLADRNDQLRAVGEVLGINPFP